MSHRRRRAGAGPAAVLLAVALLGGCGGDDGGSPRGPEGALSVQGAFVPEPPLTIAALYLTLDNRTGDDDVLLGVVTDAAEGAEVHGPGMAAVNGLPVPAGEQTVLEPGGAHVMLIGMEGVEAGDVITVTLQFAVHPPLTIEVPVAPIGSLEAP